eukprot:TRINITY_DN62595_c0_g1_i1.p1 TRINITY_DN62595_c0_g1~~TRINITY_DN62595_c0_g1_i1.p1  ORF type:complete len:207 (-),score=32.47 TRINITY_DN62595_c0_g1_i1:19-639(-)
MDTVDLESQSSKGHDHFAVGQVTIRLPLELRPLPLLAILLGFVPWALPLLLLSDALLERSALSLFALGVLALTSVVNEFVLKPFFDEPRPEASACRDAHGKLLPGMPSGHVLTCQSLLAFFFILNLREHIAIVALVLVLLMPAMPWARWYNGDHSCKQVVVSVIVGTVLGAAYYLVYGIMFPEMPDPAAHHALHALLSSMSAVSRS